MAPAPKRLYYALTCAVIGFVVGAALAPRGGARYTEQRWSDTLFETSGLTLGAIGAGLGAVVGLIVARRHGLTGSSGGKPNDRRESSASSEPGPGETRRRSLRQRRKRDAPKRFGKRGR